MWNGSVLNVSIIYFPREMNIFSEQILVTEKDEIQAIGYKQMNNIYIFFLKIMINGKDIGNEINLTVVTKST